MNNELQNENKARDDEVGINFKCRRIFLEVLGTIFVLFHILLFGFEVGFLSVTFSEVNALPKSTNNLVDLLYGGLALTFTLLLGTLIYVLVLGFCLTGLKKFFSCSKIETAEVVV